MSGSGSGSGKGTRTTPFDGRYSLRLNQDDDSLALRCEEGAALFEYLLSDGPINIDELVDLCYNHELLHHLPRDDDAPGSPTGGQDTGQGTGQDTTFQEQIPGPLAQDPDLGIVLYEDATNLWRWTRTRRGVDVHRDHRPYPSLPLVRKEAKRANPDVLRITVKYAIGEGSQPSEGMLW